MGATPASIAKAASERIRPAWDQALRMRRRGDDPDAGLGEELGSLLLHDDLERRLQIGRLGLAGEGPPSRGAQGRDRRALLERLRGTNAQPRTAEDQRVGAQVAQPAAEGLGCVDHERLERGDRPCPLDHRSLARHEQHAQGLAAATSPWLGEVLARERLAGSADRVELVALGAVATGGSPGAVDLDDPLALLEQIGREPGTEAARALDGPDPPVRGATASEGQDALGADGVGRHRQVSRGTTGRGHDRGGVGVELLDERRLPRLLRLARLGQQARLPDAQRGRGHRLGGEAGVEHRDGSEQGPVSAQVLLNTTNVSPVSGSWPAQGCDLPVRRCNPVVTALLDAAATSTPASDQVGRQHGARERSQRTGTCVQRDCSPPVCSPSASPSRRRRR